MKQKQRVEETYKEMDSLRIDKLDSSDDRIDLRLELLAVVEHNRIQFAFDGERTLLAIENTHRLLHFSNRDLHGLRHVQESFLHSTS